LISLDFAKLILTSNISPDDNHLVLRLQSMHLYLNIVRRTIRSSLSLNMHSGSTLSHFNPYSIDRLLFEELVRGKYNVIERISLFATSLTVPQIHRTLVRLGFFFAQVIAVLTRSWLISWSYRRLRSKPTLYDYCHLPSLCIMMELANSSISSSQKKRKCPKALHKR